jgi:hypothetical protein
MASRTRGRLFAALVAACTLVAIAAMAAGIGSGGPAAGTAAATGAPLAAGARPAVLVRSLADPHKGQLLRAPLRAGSAARLPLRCDRVHAAGGRGLCLSRGGGFAQGYRAKVLDADGTVRAEVPVEGIPSRARVSPDGRHGAVTLFVSGHSYAEDGAFSTQTTLIDLRAGRRIADLEAFTVLHRGRQVTAVDVNFWGVTFARDSDRFYATMATGGQTYLLEGSVRARTARVLHENVECPSLSPDGTRVAYKRRTGDDARPWRLTVLDLRTRRETPLAEPRSIDDQAEWLDDGTVVYGLGGDVLAVPADGRGRPRRLVARAESPAVLR